jgi:uncharacterized membrane protein YphA (DoxX/SURF4 family)
MAAGNDPRRPALNYVLWTIQVLLAALFLFAGVMKFVMPVAEMTKQMPLPGWFLWFIGVAEVLGGLGLILPSLLRLKPHLTPLAAAGLVVIMIGAIVVSEMTGGAKAALFPLAIGLLAAFVAYGRWRLWPIPAKA